MMNFIVFKQLLYKEYPSSKEENDLEKKTVNKSLTALLF